MKEISLRLVTEGDARQIWLWANDPDAREASFSHARIPWEEHLEWYQRRLRDPLTTMYIVMDAAGTPVGVVRFQGGNTPDGAIVSLTIAREYRGLGFGSRALRLATLKASREKGTRRFIAFVRAGNGASLRTFMKAGFGYRGRVRINGEEAGELVLVLESREGPAGQETERDPGQGG